MDTRTKYLNLSTIALICLLGIAIYSNTFHSPFQFDDKSSITENFAIRDIHHLETIWDYLPTRFLTYLSVAFNYHFHQFNITGYHVFNLAIHLASAILLWWLVMLTFSTAVMKRQKIANHAQLVSFFSGMIFVAHPIQTQAVTYIIQRAASMAAMFYLASLCFYVKSRLVGVEASLSGFARRYYIASLMMAVMAMFTKEITITIPLAICLYEFSFLRTHEKFNWKRIIPFLLTLLIIPLTMLAYKSRYFTVIQQEATANTGISSWQYLLTQFRAIATYIRLLFFPVNQNLDYDFRISRTLFEPPVLWSLGFIVLVLIIATRMFSKNRLASFGIFWFFLTLLPESSIMPIRDVIYEHRLYLPMAGFSIFLVSAVYGLVGKRSIKAVVVILSSVVVLYSILTYNRNIIWKDEFTLWNDAVLKSPGKARPYNNRGKIYQEKGSLDQAFSDCNKAIELNSQYADAYNNRGNVYLKKGNLDQAISDYNKAIELNPKYTDAYNNRGSAYLKKGNLGQAISDRNKAIELNSRYAAAYNNRGNAYLKKGNLDQAVSDYNKAIELNPKYIEAYYSRAVAYFCKRDYPKAWEDIRRAEVLGYKVNPTFIMNLKKASGKNS